MRFFKNRGDIYISKSGNKKGREEKILFCVLSIIIIFTIVFVVLLSQRYDSVSQFFAEGEVSASQAENEMSEEALPKIEGKTNFLFFETDDEDSVIHYVFLIQADKDACAYKVSALSPDMMIDKQSLNEIYSLGAGASLQTKLTEYFGFEIDYYARFERSSFIEFINEMGSFIYPSTYDVKFNGGSGDDTYNLRLREGEQNIDAKHLSNLLRYFIQEKKSYETANEILLYALTGLFNEDNLEDKDSLFRLFISSSSTNITVRDFSQATDALTVFCKQNQSITVYSSTAKYNNKNVMAQESVKDIKGYFSK